MRKTAMKFLRLARGDKHHLKCQEARRHLSELLEEKPQLTPEFLQLIQVHLSECPPCTGFMATLKSTINVLRGLPAQDVPASLTQALKAHARQKPSA